MSAVTSRVSTVGSEAVVLVHARANRVFTVSSGARSCFVCASSGPTVRIINHGPARAWGVVLNQGRVSLRLESVNAVDHFTSIKDSKLTFRRQRVYEITSVWDPMWSTITIQGRNMYKDTKDYASHYHSKQGNVIYDRLKKSYRLSQSIIYLVTYFICL